MATGAGETLMLGPEVRDDPAIAVLVKSFDDTFNERQRNLEKQHAGK